MLGIGRTLVSMTFARIIGGSQFHPGLIVPGFAKRELQNLRNNNLRVTENLRAQSRRLGDHAWRAWTSWAAINSCCVGAVMQLGAPDDVGDWSDARVDNIFSQYWPWGMTIPTRFCKPAIHLRQARGPLPHMLCRRGRVITTSVWSTMGHGTS